MNIICRPFLPTLKETKYIFRKRVLNKKIHNPSFDKFLKILDKFNDNQISL